MVVSQATIRKLRYSESDGKIGFSHCNLTEFCRSAAGNISTLLNLQTPISLSRIPTSKKYLVPAKNKWLNSILFQKLFCPTAKYNEFYKELFLWLGKTFRDSRPRIFNTFETRTIYLKSERSVQFLKPNAFLTCSFRFFRSNKCIRTIIIQNGKKYLDLETYRKISHEK